MRVLAADVGGTNARLAIVEITDTRAHIERYQRFPSQDSPDLASIATRFIAESGGEALTRACFAVACRVIEGVCRSANLPWTIDERELANAIGIVHTSIINDFDAIGHGIPLLEPGDIATLQAGKPVPHGNIALIGAGTGLGEAFLVWDGRRYLVQASEGGHVNFAARNELEWGLYAAARAEFDHVSYERLVSGPGLVRIYRYLVATRGVVVSEQLRDEFEREDPAAVVVRHGLSGTDPLCVEAVDTFASLFGAQAGNLALTVLATGGVYIAGGIAPRMMEKLRTGSFLKAFRDKGRLSPLGARVPVYVITNTKVGLLGAAYVAANPA